MGDVKSVGRIGLKALIYFELVTTFALVFGLVIANVLRPGQGFNIDPGTLPPASRSWPRRPRAASCRTPRTS